MVDIPISSTWHPVDASNVTGGPPSWPPLSAPTIVYTNGRSTQGAIRREWDRNNPTIVSGGSANVQTLTYDVAPGAYVQGMRFAFIAGFRNTGPTTLNVNSLGALNVYANGAPLAGGEFNAGQVAELFYDATSGTGLFQFSHSAGGVPPNPVAGQTITEPQQMTFQTLDNGLAPGQYLSIDYTSFTPGIQFGIQQGDAQANGVVLVDPDNYDRKYTNITNDGPITFDVRFARLGSSYIFSNRINATTYVYCGDQNVFSVQGSNVTMIGIGSGEAITVTRTGLGVFSITSQSNVYTTDNTGSSKLWEQLASGRYIMYNSGALSISGSSTATVSFAGTPFANSTGWTVIVGYNTGEGISSGVDVKNMFVNKTYGTGAQFVITNGAPNGTTHVDWLVTGLIPA